MKPIIFYHKSCADGFGAAYAAWTHFGNDAEYVPMAYGTVKSALDVDLLGAIEGRDVYILDFSFPVDVMQYLTANAAHVTWLDHHKTAFEQQCPGISVSPTTRYESTNDVATIVLDNSRSGAVLAWSHFRGTEPPLLLRHVQDYDLWRFKLDCTKEFNKTLWSQAPWTFEQWAGIAMLDADGYGAMYATGAALLNDHNNQVQRTVAKPRLARLWFGKDDGVFSNGLAVNAPPNLSSDAGHELATKSRTFGMTYLINNELVVNVELRSNGDFDVSHLAKAYGGGGHKNAAGFECSITQLLIILG